MNVEYLPSQKSTQKTIKPDIIVEARNQSFTICHIVAVGELKGDTKKSGKIVPCQLDSSEMGQLEQYLTYLLVKQKYRQYAYGFLTDNRDFLIVKAFRSAGYLVKGQSRYSAG